MGINRPLTQREKDNLSRKIKALGLRGNKAPGWRGGRVITTYGYVLIHLPDHPKANCNGYCREHRLIMEKCLNRFLTKEEIVHHINGNKQDNRPENLELLHRHHNGYKKHETILENVPYSPDFAEGGGRYSVLT